MLIALAACAALPASAAALSIHWNKAVRLEPAKNGGLAAVSCPSAGLCVAVDASGDVVATTRPTSGRWLRPFHVDSSPLTGVSCPTTNMCVAVDANGAELTSLNPAGGARAWSRPARVDATVGADGGPAGLVGISCPTPTLCVAVDGAASANVVTSTRPTAGAGAWKLTAVGGLMFGVSCPSAGLCVLAGTQRVVSTNPTGPASSWRATGSQSGGGVLSGIHCLSALLCVAVGYGNTSTALATTSTNPKGGAGAWRTVSLASTPPGPGDGLLDAVGCANLGLCVALDGADGAYVSTSASSGRWGAVSPIRPNSASVQNAISCNGLFCAVVDSAGVETTGMVRH